MPASVQQPCRHPAIEDGADPQAPLVRYIGALKVCEGRRADAVQFYEDLRAGLK